MEQDSSDISKLEQPEDAISDVVTSSVDKKEQEHQDSQVTSPSQAPEEAEQPTEREMTQSADQPQEDGCIFCRIARGETDTELLHSDNDFVCFRDRQPQTPHHYLVIPKAHIPNLKFLSTAHIPTVRRMHEIGREVLRQQNGNLDDYRAGYHWPPFLMVKHLHLHVLSPESQLGFLARHVVFRKDSWVFTTPESSIEYLRNKTNT